MALNKTKLNKRQDKILDTIAKEIAYSSKKTNWIKSNFDVFFKEIECRLPIFNNLREKYNFHGEILEIGAGSCWLSALISKTPGIRKIYALDISRDLLEMIGADIICRLNGNKEKIEFINADFNNLPFENNKFNIVICDASLHHAPNLSILLKEIFRVLKAGGFLIAIREPIKPLICWRKFGKSEIAKGATENIYSKREWKKYFKEAGLILDITEDFSQDDFKTSAFRIFPFRFLNGILFSRYCFFAKKCNS
ncbi:methyltransferase domain-containing protein [Patescibacteria group bacterium]|nr:methyltransferase domain-containing protein [Patescibacteria group bacterium]MBU4579823.1 methyltransferase domain-containing protein [Patescibacteria group bacterium]